MRTNCVLRFGSILAAVVLLLVGSMVAAAEEVSAEVAADAVMTPAGCSVNAAPAVSDIEPANSELLLFAPAPESATETSCCWFEDDCTYTAWQKCKVCPNPSNYRCVISVNPETGCSPQGGGSVICL